MEFSESWNNHRLSDVEAAIKAKVGELEDSQYDVNYVNIIGGTNRAYNTDDSEIYIEYTVNHVTDGVFQTQVDYSVTLYTSATNATSNINGELIESGTAQAANEHTVLRTTNLSNFILSHDAYSTIVIKMVVNGKEKYINFSKYAVGLRLDSSTSLYNTSLLKYICTVTKGANAELHIKVIEEDYETVISLNTDSTTTTAEWRPSLGQGTYTIEAYIAINTNLLFSNTVSTSITIGEAQGSAIIYNIDTVPRVNTEFTLNFTVYNPSLTGTDSFPVELHEVKNNDNGDDVSVLVSRKYIYPEDLSNFVIDITNIQNNYILRVPASTSEFGIDVEPAEVRISFTAVSDGIDWSIPQNYTAAWDANTGSYAVLSADKKWYDKTGNYYLQLPFNNLFGAYGFGNEYNRSQGLPNSTDGNYLTLGYNYKIESSLAPFIGGGARGITTTGCTFSITFKARTSSTGSYYIVDSPDLQICIVREELIIKLGTYDIFKSSANTTDKVAGGFNMIPNGTKVNLIITIEPYTTSTKYMSVYLNGELCGRRRYDTLTNLNSSNSFLNRFSSNYLDVYNIYYYEYCFTDMACLQLASLLNKTGDSVIQKYKDNHFYDAEGRLTLEGGINYGLYKAEQLGRANAELDFAVVACTDFRTYTGEDIFNTSSYRKDITQYFYVYYFKTNELGRGIIDPRRTFMITGPGSALRIRRQGTTTAKEPTANIRLDIRSANTCTRYAWNGSEFSTTSTLDSLGNVINYAGLISDIEHVWSIKDGPSFKVLTLKHNPNESTQSRNLPTSRWYEKCARTIACSQTSIDGDPTKKIGQRYRTVLTPPQITECNGDYTENTIMNLQTRQTIEGLPGIGFLITPPANSQEIMNPTKIQSISFAGQYDLITDKTNQAVFGFGSNSSTEDYSIEFRNNTSAVLNFRAPITATDTQQGREDISNAALEYRFPDSLTNYTGDSNGSIGLKPDDPLPKLFNFVIECTERSENEQVYIIRHAFKWFFSSSNPEYDENLAFARKIGIPEATITSFTGNYNVMTYTHNGDTCYLWTTAQTPWIKKLKFRIELPLYVVVPQICLNALLLEWGLLIDQDTKNQFFTHFKGDEYTYTVNDETYTYPTLRLLAYDMDTSWGADNNNYITHNPWELYEDGLYDGEVDSNDSTSGLKNGFWPLVYACYSKEIEDLAVDLQGENGLLVSRNIKKIFFEDHIDIYNELIYNENSLFSYADALPHPGTDKDLLLQKIHGSDKLTTSTFIEERCKFLQGKYFHIQKSIDYKKSVFAFTEYPYAYEIDANTSAVTLPAYDKSSLTSDEKLLLSRLYLPHTLYTRTYYNKNSNGELVNGVSNALWRTYTTHSSREAFTFPNAIIVCSNTSKSSNVRRRGWYRYTIDKSNEESLVDSNFLDYFDYARDKGINYYPSKRFVYEGENSAIIESTTGAWTGFILRTPTDEILGTKRRDGSSDIIFRVYGPYMPTSNNMKDFEYCYLFNQNLANFKDLDAAGMGIYDSTPLLSNDLDGWFYLGLSGITSLINNEMPAFGPSNITGIDNKLMTVPDYTYLSSYQASQYIKSNSVFANTLRLRVSRPSNYDSTTLTPKTTLDLRKPVYYVSSSNYGLRYVDTIYCYAQARTDVNSESITNNGFNLFPDSELRDVATLDFRYNIGEPVIVNAGSDKNMQHPVYPSNVWALIPLIYLQNNYSRLLSLVENPPAWFNGINFTWINGSPEYPIFTHAVLNHATRIADQTSLVGKYVKVTGNTVDYKSEPDTANGYVLFDWENDALITSLANVSGNPAYSYWMRSKSITIEAFKNLIKLNHLTKWKDDRVNGKVLNFKVQGYIKINNDIDLSENLTITVNNRAVTKTVREWLNTDSEFKDLYIYNNSGTLLTGKGIPGTNYF